MSHTDSSPTPVPPDDHPAGQAPVPPPQAGTLSPARMFFREFIVDFLGSLVPGYIFIGATFAALIIPCLVLARVFTGVPVVEPLVSNNLKEVIAAFRFEVLATTLVFAYVVGCVLYRQNPKKPDENSWAVISRDEPDGGPVGPRDAGGRFPAVEFPYYHLHEYLSKRGLEHLAALVPWRGLDPATHTHRTKHFINILKTRIEFAYPERYSAIARNEGHVRLMSSGWYCNCALLWIAAAGFGVGAVSIGLRQVMHAGTLDYAWVLFGPVFVFLSSYFGNKYIGKVFHYVRRREVINVLETAYWASRQDPRILDDLDIRRS